jgi:cytochrome c biogenesis protein CcdA
MGAPFLIVAAFLAGVLSFSSPCCLPLLPGYVAYVSGDPGAQQRVGRTMRAAALFTVGFGVTFTALGASASWLGAALLASRPSLVRAAGALVVAVGVLTVAGAEPRVLARERRLVVASGPRCKRATGVGSLGSYQLTKEDPRPWPHEYRPLRPSARRSTSCSPTAASC